MGKEMKWLGCWTWLISALAAFNVGLNIFGWGVGSWAFVYNNLSWAIQPTAYIVGLSGLISLVMWLRGVMDNH
jgi:hypothetical protein